jgi:predicted protein tyrosine phosphatase
LFKNHASHQARSAGTSDKARVKVNQKLIDWADVIFVMERKHQQMLKKRFLIVDKYLMVLEIEDNYQFNDPELIDILKDCLSDYF